MLVPIHTRIQENIRTDLIREVPDGARILVKNGQEVTLADKIAEFYEINDISTLEQKRAIVAGCWGKIKEIKKPKEIFIETVVIKILGAAGNGKFNEGLLKFLTEREGILTADLITPDLAQSVVVCGVLDEETVIRKAKDLNLAGIVCGGTHKELFDANQNLALTIVEGFGHYGIGEDVWNLLLRFKEKYAIINHDTILLPLSPNEQKEETKRLLTEKELQVGDYVRVSGGPKLGTQGKITQIGKTEETMNNGLKAIMVEIEEAGRVPVNNIEIIDGNFSARG